MKNYYNSDLQKKLIPLNIFVCLLSIVAIISLTFLPIFTFDVGKILNNEATINYVNNTITQNFDKSEESTESEENNEGTFDYSSIIVRIIEQLFGSVKGKLSITAYSSLKVAIAPAQNKSKIVMDELFFGKQGLISSIIDSVIESISNFFTEPENKAIMEETLVSAIVGALVDEDSELSDKLTAENIANVTATFKSLENLENDDVSPVVQELCSQLEEIFGEKIEDEDFEKIKNEVQDIYDMTRDALDGAPVTMEAIICVTASSNMALGELNISELISGIFKDDENSEPDLNMSIKFSDNANDENDIDDESDKKTIVTNYNDLLAELGLGAKEQSELKDTLKQSLFDMINSIIEEQDLGSYLAYYGYLSYVMLFFIGLWFILFLFSFFHMFAQNKRFMMWYVKLFCWIPSVIWLVLRILPVIANTLIPEIWSGEEGALVQAIFSGLTSYTWINGLCYVLLWLVSLVWAFPIKHKIRKELRS